MDNLRRELAPVSDAAWAQIEEEARRTFTRDVAGRRVVDVAGPAGFELSAVGTGHLRTLEQAPVDGVVARARQAQPVIELRAPFTVTWDAVDDVDRGSQDSDWQPVKDAAAKVAHAEDGMIFDGFAAAGIAGIRRSTSNARLTIPEDIRQLPDTIAQALSELRLAGVNGPYSLVLSAAAYTGVSETTDSGYPVVEHVRRLLPDGGQIVWAPAIDGALLLSTRGGDYKLHLGQDLSIGYTSHDARGITLYLQESLTFLAFTAEASVVLTSS